MSNFCGFVIIDFTAVIFGESVYSGEGAHINIQGTVYPVGVETMNKMYRDVNNSLTLRFYVSGTALVTQGCTSPEAVKVTGAPSSSCDNLAK